MSDIVAWDKDGNIVEPDDPNAVGAEATDDDGIRSYLTKTPLPDIEFEDSDEIDRIIESPPKDWDLPFTDLEGLIAHLIAVFGGGQPDPDVLEERVASVMLMPQWPNAPELLKTQVAAYLAG